MKTLPVLCALCAWCLLLSSCGRGKPGHFDRAGYHVRQGVVWYLPSWTSEAFVVVGADAATFKFPLPKGSEQTFARDAKQVFLNGKVIPGADPATFEIVDHRFTRDAKNVYCNHEVFCDDPAHFSRVSVNFVKNGHAVYLITQGGKAKDVSRDTANFREISPGAEGVTITPPSIGPRPEKSGDVSAADVASRGWEMEVVAGYSFCVDSTQVFVNGNLIEGAQPGSFKILRGGYARDAARLFYFDEPMPDGTDMESFTPLAGGYAKDRARVYYLGKVLEGADAGTFEITDPKWPKAKDKNRKWEQGSEEK